MPSISSFCGNRGLAKFPNTANLMYHSMSRNSGWLDDYERMSLRSYTN